MIQINERSWKEFKGLHSRKSRKAMPRKGINAEPSLSSRIDFRSRPRVFPSLFQTVRGFGLYFPLTVGIMRLKKRVKIYVSINKVGFKQRQDE